MSARSIVSVQTMAGDVLQIEATAEATILDLKTLIHSQRAEFAVTQQRLVRSEAHFFIFSQIASSFLDACVFRIRC